MGANHETMHEKEAKADNSGHCKPGTGFSILSYVQCKAIRKAVMCMQYFKRAQKRDHFASLKELN